MEILVFLLGLGCLILVAWAMAAPAVLGIAILGGLVFGRERRQQNRHQEPPSLTPPKIQERNSAQSTIAAPPPPSAPPRRVVQG